MSVSSLFRRDGKIYTATPKLNKILKERDITQTQLSQMTGIPQGTISRFDRSRQHMMSNIVTIAKALDLAVEDLFDIEEQAEEK